MRFQACLMLKNVLKWKKLLKICRHRGTHTHTHTEASGHLENQCYKEERVRCGSLSFNSWSWSKHHCCYNLGSGSWSSLAEPYWSRSDGRWPSPGVERSPRWGSRSGIWQEYCWWKAAKLGGQDPGYPARDSGSTEWTYLCTRGEYPQEAPQISESTK